MADEPDTIADTGIELETPAIEPTVETNDLPEVVEEDAGAEVDEELFDENGNPVEAETQPEPTTSDDDDLEEVDLDGKKFKAPKGLKDRMLMHADYTRKTQEIAAIKQITVAEMQAQAHIANIDQTLKEYEKVDWATWRQQDYMAAQNAFQDYTLLKDNRTQAVQSLTQAQQHRSQAAQQDYARRVEETRKFAEKEIKGWTPKLGDELYAFAKSSGLSEEGIRSNLSPQFLAFLHKAHVGDQMLKRQAAGVNKPRTATPAPRPQPLRTVAAKSSPPARVSLKDADMDAYVAARKRGVGG